MGDQQATGPAADGSGAAVARVRPSRTADRLGRLPSYPLAGAADAVARLRAEGRRVIDLGAGDPGLPVPEPAVSALRRAARDPELQGYAFQRGLPRFRSAVSSWMERRFGRRPDPGREVLPLLGSKDGIAHLAFALLDPGDTVLVPDPGYAACLGGSLFAGGRVVRVPLREEDGFLVPPARIREAPGRLRLVYLNYPNNPTGATADGAYLAEAAAACRERGAVLAHDHPYAEIYYGDTPPPGLLGSADRREGWVEFHTLSKSFNMTGWRIGFAVGDAALVRALARVKSFFDTGVFLPIQAAAAAALEAADAFLPGQREALRERRDVAVRSLRDAGFEVRSPRATPYLWIPVPGGRSSAEFAGLALERTGVVVMPGSDLGEGGEGWFRVALTRPPGEYGEAAERLAGLT